MKSGQELVQTWFLIILGCFKIYCAMDFAMNEFLSLKYANITINDDFSQKLTFRKDFTVIMTLIFLKNDTGNSWVTLTLNLAKDVFSWQVVTDNNVLEFFVLVEVKNQIQFESFEGLSRWNTIKTNRTGIRSILFINNKFHIHLTDSLKFKKKKTQK